MTVGAGENSRRRIDVINSCKKLDDLHAAFRKEGYVNSRQALYLRLIPQRADSREGKRHVTTVPVKLRKGKNTLRNSHAEAPLIMHVSYEIHDFVKATSHKLTRSVYAS